MGLLTTVFLMGIMTGFLGILLLQLIKRTLRGLLEPCNDYFFFSWESRKSDLKRIWWAFLSFSDGEGFEWKPELKPQTWVWEQSMRWDVTGTEGKAVLQERMDKISQISSPPISICSPFLFLFCIPTAFCLLPLTLNSLLFLSCDTLFQEK